MAAACGGSRAFAHRAARPGRAALRQPCRSSMSSPTALAISATLVMAYHHAAVAVADHASEAAPREARPAAARTRGARRLAPRAARGDGACSPQPPVRGHRRHAVGRVAPPRAAGAGARGAAGSAAARRADQPPRLDAITWLENFLADYAGAVMFVTHDRAFLQRLATRIVELDRGMLTSWPGDYATFLRKKEEWLANEAIQQREVRQEAGRGRSVAATGRQGAADAQRRARAGAAGHARGTGGAAGTVGRRPHAGRDGRSVRPGGVRGRGCQQGIRRDACRRRLLLSGHARRSDRPHRAKWRGQDHAAAAAARRDRAGCGRGAPRRQRPGGVLRPAARAARSGSHGRSTRSATGTTP